MPKQHIWRCPKCQSGVRAPSKPRRDDARRYCLDCTAKTGRLVERTCEHLEKKRATRAQQHAAKRATAKEKAKQRMAAYPNNLYGVFKRYAKLEAWGVDLSYVNFELRFSRRKAHASGHCWGNRIVVTATGDVAEAHEVILHELAHSSCWHRFTDKVGHGAKFRSTLVDAVRELINDPEWKPEGRMDACWELDRTLTMALARHHLNIETKAIFIQEQSCDE